MLTCGYLLDIMYLLTSGVMIETDQMIMLYLKCVMPA